MVRGLGVCFVALVVLWRALAPSDGPPSPAIQFEPGLQSGAPDGAAGGAPASRSVGSFKPVVLARTVGGPCLAADGEAPLVIEPGPVGFVTVTYCLLLRRPPDPEGLAYWSDQIDQGLSPVEMVLELSQSDEYQARGLPGFRASLAKLTLSADRQAERDRRAEQAAAEEAERARQAEAEAAAQAAAEAQSAEDSKRAERLRVRQELSVAEFDGWVAGIGFTEVDVVTPALVHGRIDGNGQRINVALVHLSATRGVSVSPGDRGRATVGTWAAEIGADVAINGNWYAPYDGPAVSGGVVYGGDDHFYTSLFGFTADGDAIIDHHREINAAVDDRVVEGVSGHPTLVYRGEPTTDFGTDPTFLARHPRTAIALDRSGDVLILVTVDGRSSVARGMTGAETVELLVSLGAHDGVMLDGGGSTTMWIANRGIVNRPSGSPRSVGNQLAVFGD